MVPNKIAILLKQTGCLVWYFFMYNKIRQWAWNKCIMQSGADYADFFFLVLRFAWWCARLEFPLVHVYLKDWNRNCCCCWYLHDVKADIIKLAAAAAEMVGFVGGECDLGKSKGGRRRTHKYIWKMFTQRYMQIQQERGMIRRNAYRKYHNKLSHAS